jgi:very-short-patch-repair endonuclease
MDDFDIDGFLARRSISLQFTELEDIVDKWAFIRQAYMEAMPGIMGPGADALQTTIVLDWDHHMNAFEKDVWHSIRLSRAAFLPQFPVFNYFIDFANPRLRLALELDGKQHDPDKDRKRDELLWSIGWRTFRIPAREARNAPNFYPNQDDFDVDDPSQEEIIKTWLFNSADGVVKALEWVYFTDQGFMFSTPHGHNLHAWAMESLERHRLIDFPISGGDFS